MQFTPVVTAALVAVAVVLPFSSARAQSVDSTGGPELSLEQAIAKLKKACGKTVPTSLDEPPALRSKRAKK